MAVRFIQVGTGGWGACWCREFLPRLVESGRLVPAAAVDRDPAQWKHAVEGFGIDEQLCFADAREAFERVEADFVIVVVPPAHHEAVVDLAAERGMHVLSEKPIADTMEGCARIYEKVRTAGVKMAVTMSHRFDRDKQTVQRLIESGRYGRMNYIVCRFTNNMRRYGDWGAAFRHEIPDTLLIEGAVHHFDIFRAFSGADARTVYALTWNPPWGEYKGDSTGLVTMEMTNGVRGFYEGAKANATSLNRWTEEYFRVECEAATIVLDRRRVTVERHPDQRPEPAEEVPLAKGQVWMNALLAEQFVDWLEGGPAPATQVEDNMQCCALTFAAIESAHTGEVVGVQEYLAKHLGDEKCQAKGLTISREALVRPPRSSE